jgi:hypothetical protein
LARQLGVETRPRPFQHLSDQQLLAGLERLRHGQPSGIHPYPGPPETWPPSPLDHLTDAELIERAEAMAAKLRGRVAHHPERRQTNE